MERRWGPDDAAPPIDEVVPASSDEVAKLIELFPAPVVALRPDGLATVANAAYVELFGLGPEIETLLITEVIHPEDLEAAWDLLRDCPVDEVRGPVELRVLHVSGEYVRVSWALRLDSRVGWFVTAGMDVTARHARHRELLNEARTDQLTGLANRSGLLAALDRLTAKDLPLSVAIVDLDRFKAVNDTFGHSVGDEVLKIVAARLRSNAPHDSIVCRTGGDEFVIVTPASEVVPRELGPVLTGVLSEPIRLGTRNVAISGSVGIAIDGTRGSSDLLQEADFALYESKQVATASWTIADHSLIERRRREVELERRMRIAIEDHELVPWFQPIIDLGTSEPIAYEALLRWPSSDGTVAVAGQFVDLATDMGLIASIGRQVVPQSLDFVESLGDGCLTLNLSPAELEDDGWLEYVVKEVDLRGIDHARIAFEITETTAISDLATAHRQLQYLVELGFPIVLDDFGAGYSSLTYLTSLPIDGIKLDRALLANRHGDARAQQIFEAIISFVGELDYLVIVEGVETASDHEYLVSLGVEYAQGWHYGYAESAQTLQLGHRAGVN